MTSQSSASSLTKQRQSWMDLVSQATPAAGETAVVCSVQVHSHQPPPEESSVPSETPSIEESSAAEGDEHRDVLPAHKEGES